MLVFEGIEENFVFMVLETQKQLSGTVELLTSPNTEATDKFLSRDDYIDNLKTIIENQCYSRINDETGIDRSGLNAVRAIHTVSVNLERIADNCVNIIRQYDYLKTPSLLNLSNCTHMFDQLNEGMSRIIPVFEGRDLAGALDICRTENEIDRIYRVQFNKIIAELKTGRDIEDHVTTLFIYRYLERMGDTLLNIGEALIFAILGERVKINQFLSLKQSLEQTGFEGDIADISFQSILGTRSGCHIGHIEHADSGEVKPVESVFKEGNREKIQAEKENLEIWANVAPGLAPRVFSYSDTSSGASILIEFLNGRTLDEIILSDSTTELINATERFTETLPRIWQHTKMSESRETDYIMQLRDRLERVLKVHPESLRGNLKIGNRPVLATTDILDICEEIESSFAAPVTVFIHGDLNVNNILYNVREDRIHFVDLYRSVYADYVQDISVFLVSNFRIPVFDNRIRSRLTFIIRKTLEKSRQISKAWNDETFEARLAFGLARSFFTSTRFELNRKFARQMLLRSHYLLETIIRHSSIEPEMTTYTLPAHILDY